MEHFLSGFALWGSDGGPGFRGGFGAVFLVRPFVGVGRRLKFVDVLTVTFATYRRGPTRASGFLRGRVGGVRTRRALRASLVRGDNGVLGPHAVSRGKGVMCMPVSS